MEVKGKADCKTCKFENLCLLPDFVRKDLKLCKTYQQKKPRVPTTEETIRAKAIDEFLKEATKRISDMILNHQKQLDFVSGLVVANHIMDDVAEKLK